KGGVDPVASGVDERARVVVDARCQDDRLRAAIRERSPQLRRRGDVTRPRRQRVAGGQTWALDGRQRDGCAGRAPPAVALTALAGSPAADRGAQNPDADEPREQAERLEVPPRHAPRVLRSYLSPGGTRARRSTGCTKRASSYPWRGR